MRKKIFDQLKKNIPQLPSSQKRIAEYFLHNWRQLPLKSIKEIAAETHTSTASVNRFCHLLAFDGFYQFKEALKKENIRTFVNPVEKFRLQQEIKGKESIVKVAEKEIENINRLLIKIDEQTFSEAVKMIEKSKKIYCFGVGISSIFATLAAYLFSEIQLEAVNLKNGEQSTEEKILKITPDDLLILFSFFPYSRSTIEYAAFARQKKIPILAFSDAVYSPVSTYSSLTIEIPRENILFTTPIAALSTLINSFATEIALKRKEELSRLQKENDRALSRFYI